MPLPLSASTAIYRVGGRKSLSSENSSYVLVQQSPRIIAKHPAIGAMQSSSQKLSCARKKLMNVCFGWNS